MGAGVEVEVGTAAAGVDEMLREGEDEERGGDMDRDEVEPEKETRTPESRTTTELRNRFDGVPALSSFASADDCRTRAPRDIVEPA